MWARAGVLILAGVVLVVATTRDPRANMPAPGGARRGIPWGAVLGRDDKNKDGKVSKEEFSGSKQLFDLIDANHDGFITREEHEIFLQRAPSGSPPKP